MAKALSIAELPVLVVTGIVSQKIAARLWSRLFDSDAPDTAQKDVNVPALLAAAVLEGTLYKLARMGVDRGLRVAVARSTGGWVGRVGEGE
jgi:hypothetical protein